MSNHNYSDEKIEVIDPSDDRYKGDDYFNKNSSQNNQNLKLLIKLILMVAHIRDATVY